MAQTAFRYDLCDIPFQAVHWEGGQDTNLTKQNNLFTTVNRELEVERVDFNAGNQK